MLLNMNQIPLWGLEASPVWSVAGINRYLRELLESDYRLQDLWVAGEVSNASRPASGHFYFTLKDAEASLRCVMWRSDVARQTFLPRDGQAAEVHGRISLYEAGGQYQLYADALRPAGEGALFQEFLRLKARLEAEGLFAPERKRPLPAWPARIGVVTSPTGAALQDVLNVLRRRFPLAGVVLAPTPVQGAEAPTGIVAALRAVNKYSHPDVILLVRGGGSLEDLAAFNDEAVARAIVASKAPVVSGVGHETDFTIADFAADVRAPTPSAAAEIVTPDRLELKQTVEGARRSLADSFADLVQRSRWSLADREAALRLASPRSRVANASQRVDDMVRRSATLLRHNLELRRAAISGLVGALKAVDPLAVLDRGYAVVRRADDGSLVRSVRQVRAGDGLQVRVSDGTFPAEARPRRKAQQGDEKAP
jgi:exodeoxyribonuclease VII large subunit